MALCSLVSPAGGGQLLTALRDWRKGAGLFVVLPAVFRVLPRCRTAVLGSSTVRRAAVAQVESSSVSVRGGARGLPAAAARRAAVDREDPAHVARASTCGPSWGGST